MRKFLSNLFHVVGERKLWLTTLGRTGRQYIFLVRDALELDDEKPNLLIAAGFHGEEIAGPWAILKWIDQAPDEYFEKANLSFLPCVSPVAFNRGARYPRKEKTNAGFCYPAIKDRNGKPEKPSVEGKILLANMDTLGLLAKDGFLSLHEDDSAKEFYIYAYNRGFFDKWFADAMRDEEVLYFSRMKDGTPVNENHDPMAVVEDGIIYNHHDGSFEDMLVTKGISVRAIVTETPAQGIALEKRVEAGAALISKFIDLST
jgi:hypothetical protein